MHVAFSAFSYSDHYVLPVQRRVLPDNDSNVEISKLGYKLISDTHHKAWNAKLMN